MCLNVGSPAHLDIKGPRSFGPMRLPGWPLPIPALRDGPRQVGSSHAPSPLPPTPTNTPWNAHVCVCCTGSKPPALTQATPPSPPPPPTLCGRASPCAKCRSRGRLGVVSCAGLLTPSPARETFWVTQDKPSTVWRGVIRGVSRHGTVRASESIRATPLGIRKVP